MSLTLPELIARHRRDRTFYQLVKDSDGGPGESAWHAWSHGTRVPKPENMPAIATALGVTPWEVLLATGASVGITPPPETGPPMPALFDRLRAVPVDMLREPHLSAIVTIVTIVTRHDVEH